VSPLGAVRTTNNGKIGRVGRRAALTAATLALSTAGMALAAGTAAAQTSTNGQSVLGTATEPYVCTDESCSNPWNDADVVQRVPSNTPPTNQPWIITNVVTGGSIDDPNSSSTQGTQIEQWGENDGDNQKWMAVPSTGANAGYYTVVGRSNGLCLDVSGASTADDAPVIQWACSGNANQQWKLGLTSNPDVPGGEVYTFTNKNSGLPLAVSGSQSGAGLIQSTDPGTQSSWYGKRASYSFVTTPAYTKDAPIIVGAKAVLDSNGNEEYSGGGSDYLDYTCVTGYHFVLSSDKYYGSSTGDSQAQLSLVGYNTVTSTLPWESQASSELAFAESTTPMTATDAIVVNGGTEIRGVGYSEDYGSVKKAPGDGGDQVQLTCSPN
jgi:hypothetical protein